MRQIKKVHKYGEKFDSKLELYFYELLLEAKIPFDFQSPYELVPSFKYNGKTIRPMTLTVDFDFTDYGLNVIVDTKGFWREANKMKWKLLQWGLSDKQPILFFPSSRRACVEVIEELKKLIK